MILEFLEPAYIEYQEAIEYYNLQSDGLGNKFIVEIDRTISIIKNYPESFTKYTEHLRKAVVTAFPYNLIYSIQEEKTIIMAVAHQHRKPNYWLKREA
ncbi:plasmid stabilization protein [bacterium]|nr:plasmid stabilization protein [bacterium]